MESFLEASACIFYRALLIITMFAFLNHPQSFDSLFKCGGWDKIVSFVSLRAGQFPKLCFSHVCSSCGQFLEWYSMKWYYPCGSSVSHRSIYPARVAVTCFLKTTSFYPSPLTVSHLICSSSRAIKLTASPSLSILQLSSSLSSRVIRMMGTSGLYFVLTASRLGNLVCFPQVQVRVVAS